jgi:UDP-N-acetylglucosamine--N-acetylmuramyl-(pentapeptide) pyrophosphoryl-undecaprenol N-acetylglucosamine transferase
MRVVLAGGGTAGHIEPALALADALRLADSGISVTCLGTKRGLETRLVPLRGYALELIPAVPLPRSVTPQLLTVPGRLASAVHTAGQILERVHAEVLVGFGGYVSAPAYLAARRKGVPIVVHEANPSPGFANKLGAMFTTHVFTSQPDTKIKNGQYLGLPIRRDIAELNRLAEGDRARNLFGLRPDMPVLLVFGGSQGAQSINHALAGAIGSIRDSGIQVLHVTGPNNASEVASPALSMSAGAVPYVSVPYIDDMKMAYAAADFALCRAGAMTCAELAAVGLPAAYVPLPHGNGEQRLNALPIVRAGGGLMIDNEELTAEWITSTLLPVLTNIDQVYAMSQATASLGRRDADRMLARAVIGIVTAERAAAAQAAQAAQAALPPAGPAALPAADAPDPLERPFDPFARAQQPPAAQYQQQPPPPPQYQQPQQYEQPQYQQPSQYQPQPSFQPSPPPSSAQPPLPPPPPLPSRPPVQRQSQPSSSGGRHRR